MDEILKTCGDCKHYFQNARDPHNIKNVTGQCRFNPPQMAQVPVNNGQMLQFTSYPVMKPDMAACSHHEVSLLLSGS